MYRPAHKVASTDGKKEGRMPSDLVWVAIISSGIGVGGALLGAGISGMVTYRVTKRQTDSQAMQVRKQIKHQESEARRERMIKARSETLTQIQNSLGSLFGAHSTFSSSAINLQALNKLGISVDDPGRKRMADEVDRQAQIIQTETINITSLRSRISDRALVAILDELTGEIGAIVHTDAGTSPEGLTGRVLNMFAGLEVLRPKLPAFYQRIEELLSGDDLESSSLPMPGQPNTNHGPSSPMASLVCAALSWR